MSLQTKRMAAHRVSPSMSKNLAKDSSVRSLPSHSSRLHPSLIW